MVYLAKPCLNSLGRGCDETAHINLTPEPAVTAGALPQDQPVHLLRPFCFPQKLPILLTTGS